MNELTEFQSRALRQLRETVAETEWELVISTIHGQHETYLEGAVGSIKLWIYEDGAELRTPEGESRLEKWDFDSLDDLRAEFVRQFTEATADPGSGGG